MTAPTPDRFEDKARRILFQNNMAEDSLFLGHITVALREAFEAGAEQMRERAENVAADFAMEHGPTHNKKMGGFAIRKRIQALPLSPEEPKP